MIDQICDEAPDNFANSYEEAIEKRTNMRYAIAVRFGTTRRRVHFPVADSQPYSQNRPHWVAGTFPDATRTQSGPRFVAAGCSGNNEERGG